MDALIYLIPLAVGLGLLGLLGFLYREEVARMARIARCDAESRAVLQ